MVINNRRWSAGENLETVDIVFFQRSWFLSPVRAELKLTTAVTLCLAGLDVIFAAGSSWVLRALLKSRETDGRDIPGTADRDSSDQSWITTWHFCSSRCCTLDVRCVCVRARAGWRTIAIGRRRVSFRVYFIISLDLKVTCGEILSSVTHPHFVTIIWNAIACQVQRNVVGDHQKVKLVCLQLPVWCCERADWLSPKSGKASREPVSSEIRRQETF